MKRLLELFENPLFLKEMRLLFRSPRTPLLHFGYLLVLGACAAGFAWYAHLSAETGDAAALWRMGAGCFKAAYALHLAVVGLFAASMASVAVSSEKERRTWELLGALPLGPAKLLAGKFLAVFTAAALMIGSSLPLWLFTLSVIGGVTAGEMAAAFLGMLGVAALAAAFGLLASALFDDSRKAFGLAFRVLLLAGGASFAVKAAVAASRPRGHFGGDYGHSVGDLLGTFGSWLPVPESAAGSVALFAACVLLAAPVLTVAVDALKPEEDRRPDPLNRQLFAVAGLAFAAYLAWQSPSLLGVGSRFSAAWLSALQGIFLLLLSLAVLPAESRPGGGPWSGGPMPGGRLLLAAFAASTVPIVAMGASDPACLAAQARVALLIPVWASLARLCLAWAPGHARSAYFGALLALLVIPAVWAALDGGPSRALALRLLELNPVLGAGLRDRETRESFAVLFHAAPARPWEVPALALVLSAGFLAAASMGPAARRRRSGSAPC